MTTIEAFTNPVEHMRQNNPSFRMLMAAFVRDLLGLRDEWQDEASDAAVEGNPQRAGYLEHMVDRVPSIVGEYRPARAPKPVKSKLILPERRRIILPGEE